MSEPRQFLHYTLTRKLGEGGMGEVWQATDTTLDREVAIKLLPDGLADDPERLARFEREAKLLAALNHPNIATIHGLHADGNRRFLAMELVAGQPLSALIPAEGLTLRRLFELAVPLADALAVAHDRGITHRDLKPDNVMVSEEGRVKVLDFGLAKLAGEAAAGAGEGGTAIATATITQEGKILGTVNYMSPEQAEGKPVDARSDVFSLGILVYEMAVGRRPFAGDTPMSTLSSIIKDNPPSLTDLKAGLPRHLDRLVRRCLSKDPERRYPNAKEVRNELEQLRAEIDSGETSSVSVPAAPKRPRWMVPVVAIGALAIVAAIVIGKLLPGPSETAAPATPRPPAGAATLQAARAEAATSVAVLPFVDLSPEGDKEYFGDGIAEELINRLARVDGIRVAGRTSSFAFKGQDQDLRAIGESLGVETIIEGSVRSAGDRVRVTAQLVGAADGFHLWSDTYDRSLSDIFAVQDEIARSIVSALRATLGADAGLGEAAAGQALTDDVEAYQHYLKARHFFRERTGDSLRQAVELFEQAIELDPYFAQAYAGLASTWSVLPGYSDLDRDEANARGLEAAQRALELDPGLAEAHAVQAMVHVDGFRWIEAEESFLQAYEASPDDPMILLWYGGRLLASGRVDEGARMIERAYEIDPASGVINGWLGHAYRARGDEQAAVRQMREARRLGWGAADTWVRNSLLEAGLWDELVEFVTETDGPDGELRARVAMIREAERDPERRAELVEELAGMEYGGPPLEVALRLDALDVAFELLDKYLRDDNSSGGSLMRLWSPDAARLRDDPRFAEWAERIGFVEYWERYGGPDQR